jgi:hypothetical protein
MDSERYMQNIGGQTHKKLIVFQSVIYFRALEGQKPFHLK